MASAEFSKADISEPFQSAAPTKCNSLAAANDDWVREQIETLDLDPIKIKLMDPVEGEGWSRHQVDEADLMYRRFLYLASKYPSWSGVPNKTVDAFWHAHILDTRKYGDDCERIFGRFLHHFPYFGLRGDQDARDLAQAAVETNRLFVAEFGQEMVILGQSSSPAKCKKDPEPWPDPRDICKWDGPDDLRMTHPVRPSLEEKSPRVYLYSV